MTAMVRVNSACSTSPLMLSPPAAVRDSTVSASSLNSATAMTSVKALLASRTFFQSLTKRIQDGLLDQAIGHIHYLEAMQTRLPASKMEPAISYENTPTPARLHSSHATISVFRARSVLTPVAHGLTLSRLSQKTSLFFTPYSILRVPSAQYGTHHTTTRRPPLSLNLLDTSCERAGGLPERALEFAFVPAVVFVRHWVLMRGSVARAPRQVMDISRTALHYDLASGDTLPLDLSLIWMPLPSRYRSSPRPPLRWFSTVLPRHPHQVADIRALGPTPGPAFPVTIRAVACAYSEELELTPMIEILRLMHGPHHSAHRRPQQQHCEFYTLILTYIYWRPPVTLLSFFDTQHDADLRSVAPRSRQTQTTPSSLPPYVSYRIAGCTPEAHVAPD
ncbi:unnamed protein product [Rhizoctonia solani]|uniref:Uncharacterized protein n=1 Tax=Rhizoctonia solani TaxID=456999 RepID=A0A8H3AV21_9AGAM|nr:unnamed protein product [Rhizoctonia solani]